MCTGIWALKLLEVIERVTRKIAPGPAPSFNEAHVVMALEIIGECGNVGRIRLSKELGLGEGATRTLLKHLKKKPPGLCASCSPDYADYHISRKHLSP